MSIGATRKVGAASPSAAKIDRGTSAASNHTQFVENIDTNNNVLVRDEPNSENGQTFQRPPSPKIPPEEFKSASPNISSSIEALALSGIFEEEDTDRNNNRKVGVYNNNQSIIKDEEVERTGGSYLKHFYEKNEHLIDIDELV